MARQQLQDYDDWMVDAENVLSAMTDLSFDQLPDQPFERWWNRGLLPVDAARLTFKDAHRRGRLPRYYGPVEDQDTAEITFRKEWCSPDRREK